MNKVEKHRKLLFILEIFSFSWPINPTPGIILYTTVAVLWCASFIYWMFNFFFLWKSTIVNLIVQINVSVTFFAGITEWITGFKYNQRIAIIFRQLAHVDRELQLKHSPNKQVLVSIFVWSFLILCAVSNIISNLNYLTIVNNVHIAFYTGYFIPICAIYSIFTLYTNLVETIRIRFQFILESIQKLKQEFNDIKRNRQLIILQSAHSDICHIIHTINSTFGISIFAVMATVFIQNLTAIYMITFNIKCLGMELLVGDYRNVVQMMYACPNLIITGYITYICEKTITTVRLF